MTALPTIMSSTSIHYVSLDRSLSSTEAMVWKHSKAQVSHRLIVWVFVLLGTTLGLAFRVNGARAGSNAKQNEDPIRRWDSDHCPTLACKEHMFGATMIQALSYTH